MAFLDILPDPNNPITYSGSANATGGTNGPGFASVKLSSNSPTVISKTHSGRVISRRLAAQTWNIGITYNPLTRNEFEPIYNFLLMKGRLSPFFVKLPQHLTSRNTSALPASMIVSGSAGATNLTVTGFSTDTYSDKPLPGDIFTITDSGDSLHTKAYRVTRVEVRGTDEQEYEGTAPTTNTARIWIHPPLQRTIINGSAEIYVGQTTAKQPKIRVIMTKDVTQYNLGTNNLYQFGLSLTEANA